MGRKWLHEDRSCTTGVLPHRLVADPFSSRSWSSTSMGVADGHRSVSKGIRRRFWWHRYGILHPSHFGANRPYLQLRRFRLDICAIPQTHLGRPMHPHPPGFVRWGVRGKASFVNAKFSFGRAISMSILPVTSGSLRSVEDSTCGFGSSA